jgi:hypothetical protein
MTGPPTPRGMRRMKGGLHVGTDEGGPVSPMVAGERAHWVCLDCGNTTQTGGEEPASPCNDCRARDWARFDPDAIDGPLLPSVELKRLADKLGSLREADLDCLLG